MTVSITHAKVSGKPAGSDPDRIYGTHWDANHTVPIATQAQAEAGTSEDVLMTPLAVSQFYDANAGSGVTTDGTQTLTNKTIALGSNTISGTVAEFNTALTDGNFATIAGTETLTNKTLTSPAITTPTGIVKGDVGLGNVDNTSDANKPVSTAQQSALDGKLANLVEDTTPQLGGTLDLNGHDIPVSPTQETFVRDSIEAAPDIRRNRVVNGCMQISQENGNSAGSTTGYFVADQWFYSKNTSGAADVSRVATVSPAGSPYRLKLDVTSADASIAAAEYAMIGTQIEGSRIADFQWGTANAKDVILRFGFKGPTGTYCVALQNAGTWNRTFLAEFTISVADTDTVVEVPVSGYTSGTWQTGDVNGLEICWVLACGSDNNGGSVGWNTSYKLATTNQSNGLSSASNNFYIFDVGLKMDVDGIGQYGAFEVPDVITEELKCFRYFYKLDLSVGGNNTRIANSVGITTSTVSASFRVPVPMRVAPTLSASAGNTFGTVGGFTTIALTTATKRDMSITLSGGSGISANYSYLFDANGASAYMNFSARM